MAQLSRDNFLLAKESDGTLAPRLVVGKLKNFTGAIASYKLLKGLYLIYNQGYKSGFGSLGTPRVFNP